MKERRGYTDNQAFRSHREYEDTEDLFIRHGLTDEVENKTPPVCVNIAYLSQMDTITTLKSELTGRAVNVAILGISSARGPKDFQNLLKSLGTSYVSTTAIDISDGVFSHVEAAGLDEVICLERDARETGLLENSQDFVLRDHLGNCCPPNIDRAINIEAGRIVKSSGLSIVNITTSDLLANSMGRKFLPFRELEGLVSNEAIEALKDKIYDLAEFERQFPEIAIQQLRESIVEIEPENSVVVFGNDELGEGEWFRTLDSHLNQWRKTGFDVLEIKSRVGNDSHNPPLVCHRHNVVMRKR